MENGSQFPFDADNICRTIAHIAAHEGNAAAVAVLASSSPHFRGIEYDSGWISHYADVALHLELPTQLSAQLFKRREGIEKPFSRCLSP